MTLAFWKFCWCYCESSQNCYYLPTAEGPTTFGRVIWPWKRPAAGRGSFWESSSFVPWLVFNACRDGSGVVPECPGSSGFIRKSSSCASAPRMRFSVLLNSFDSLFVTLPSISSETWVIESSCDLGALEFYAKLPLGCSSQFSLFNAANFLLFRVVIFSGKIMISQL